MNEEMDLNGMGRMEVVEGLYNSVMHIFNGCDLAVCHSFLNTHTHTHTHTHTASPK
jgi:hypothetical protein